MNKTFFEHAMKRIQSITLDELEALLKEHGFNPIRKADMTKHAGVCDDPTCKDCEGFDIGYEPVFKREYRLYAFVNFYLSSIQQGIQTGHAAVDLVKKYEAPASKDHCDSCGNLWDDHEFGVPAPYCPARVAITHITDAQTAMVHEWATKHKTFITLNGGPHAGIVEALDAVSKTKYPFVAFHEDEYSLGGLMTSVAVVLPDDIFNLRRERNAEGVTYFSWTRECDDGGRIIYNVGPEDADYEFVKLLKSKDLAK